MLQMKYQKGQDGLYSNSVQFTLWANIYLKWPPSAPQYTYKILFHFHDFKGECWRYTDKLPRMSCYSKLWQQVVTLSFMNLKKSHTPQTSGDNIVTNIAIPPPLLTN